MENQSKKIDRYVFCWVAKINDSVETNPDGSIFGYNPKDDYNNAKNLPLNKYGERTFCNFSIKPTSTMSGIYAIFVDDQTTPSYIGRAINFDSRWSKTNYAHISPRNCYRGGQSTNCHINSLIYDLISKGRKVDLYFFETTDYIRLERDLIEKYNPPFNTQLSKHT